MKEVNRMNKISDNLEQVLKLAQISEDMDEFIDRLKNNAEISEAKLNIAQENQNTTQLNDEKKLSIEHILNQIKIEMGLLNNPIQQEIENQEINKTLFEEEKKSEIITADKKFSTKTLGDEEH